jgi:hypothetical protein
MSNGNDNLGYALRALSAETRDACAGPRVKSTLLNELRTRRRKALVLKWWPAVAVAALVMGVWLGLPRAEAPVAPGRTVVATDVVVTPPQSAPVVPEEPEAIPVRSARPATYSIQKAPKQLSPLTPWYIHPGIPQARQGHMVYMEVGPDTARLFGLTSTGPLQAEVFLGDDGLARAIRLVRTTQIAKGE